MAAKRDTKPSPPPLRMPSVRMELPSVNTRAGSALTIDRDDTAEEHRQFPRARLEVPFHVWIGEGKERTFSATLPSVNVSVSGAFLRSTFFLRMGTRLSIRFELEENGEAVFADAEVVREDRAADESRSGFGVRFVTFHQQSEVTVARLFLGDTLRAFVDEYLGSDRAKSMQNERERVVDALAAWELLRVTRSADPWHLSPAAPPAPPPPSRGRR